MYGGRESYCEIQKYGGVRELFRRMGGSESVAPKFRGSERVIAKYARSERVIPTYMGECGSSSEISGGAKKRLRNTEVRRGVRKSL